MSADTPAEIPRQSGFSVLKDRYFATPLDSVVTVAFGLLALWVFWWFFEWAVLHAYFDPADRDACVRSEGACWAVVTARWRIVLFGLYPFDEQWRSALACLAIILTTILSCLPWFWSALRLSVLWICGFAVFYILMRGGILGLGLGLGLAPVSEPDWGGLALTLFIFAAVVLIGMPLSVVFAFLRRSKLPWISRTMGLVIDTVRSLPLLTIMFAFAVVIPFATPDWMNGQQLYRVIVGYAIFFACYQAEIIRGGIQSLPAGQEEAAMALGLTYWQRIGQIILPQAFRNALPPTINQVVITFKETSLVTIIGFFDILASGRAASGTGEWSFATIEIYVFVAFIFVFSLSRYGAYLERRLGVGIR